MTDQIRIASKAADSAEEFSFPVVKTNDQWRIQLNDDEYRIMREGGTEPAFTGIYTDTETPGTYLCKGCGATLFSSTTKFHSHCGWPSFYAPQDDNSVVYIHDYSIPNRPRIEVQCASCGSHLGHVFAGEGYDTPTDLRYCINSASLTLDEDPHA